MNITELVAKIGPENILVQPLNECIVNATSLKKHPGDTRVTFITNQFSPGDLLGREGCKIGLILWFPKHISDRIDAEINR